MNGYRPLITLWLAFAVTGGCHYRDPSVDLLEGELRYMEDQVYTLEDELHRRCLQLDACRGKNAERNSCENESSGKFGNFRSYSGTEALPIPMSIDDPRQEPVPAAPDYELVEPMPAYEEQPSVEMPVIINPDETDNLEATPREPVPARNEPIPARPETMLSPNEYEILDPEVEIPSPAESGFDLIDPDMAPAELPAGRPPLLESDEPEPEPVDGREGAAGGDEAALSLNFRSNFESSSEAQATHQTHIDAHVTHIVVNGELVTERGFDDEVTDADLLVVVEPRNKNGQYVELTGPVSVVVLDANKSGPAARVARWDYDAGSARRAIRTSAPGKRHPSGTEVAGRCSCKYQLAFVCPLHDR